MTHSNDDVTNKGTEDPQAEAANEQGKQEQGQQEQSVEQEQQDNQAQGQEIEAQKEQEEVEEQEQQEQSEEQARPDGPTYNYDHLDKAGMPPAVSIILFSLLCGAMLIIFSIIQDFTKYIFSLVALYAGFKFFQKFDQLKHRIIFIVLSIVIYFVGFIIFVGFAVVYEWNVPGLTDQILEID